MSLKENLKSVYHWATRTKKSYSQTGEDLIADSFLSGISNGCYADIGANDPVYMSNSYFFYKKGWSGICVEPNPVKAKLIKTIRPRDRVLNLGAGQKPGIMDFFVFDPDTIATFSASETEEYKKLGHKIVKTVRVEVKPLAQIFEQNLNGRELDLLSLDIEGWDIEALNSNDWSRFRPKIAIVETVHYRKDNSQRAAAEFDNFFAGVGYKKLADTYINGIYIEGGFAKAKGLDLV